MNKMADSFPTCNELKRLISLSIKEEQLLQELRDISKNILARKDQRIVLFVGPCSIHDTSILEYGEKMLPLAKKVEDKIFIVLRVFVEKPRTKFNWKGFLYDPDLNGTNDLYKGITETRKILIGLLQMGLPSVAELLDPLTSPYYEDLLTWGIIGARTALSQTHRQMASSFSFPIGFKNPLDGSIDGAIFGAQFASFPQKYLQVGQKGNLEFHSSCGNPHTHIILRGGYEKANYDVETITLAKKALLDAGLAPHIVIDCSHGNSQNSLENQVTAFQKVLHLHKKMPEIFGFMLESNLYEGSQKLQLPLQRGVSITDQCLDFAKTSKLILEAYHFLSLPG